jgi:uncharacterized RDD family membrane protein YckC
MNLQMAVIKVPTSFNIDLDFEIPEFYKRFIALLIDIVLEYFYLRIVLEIIKTIASNSDDSGFKLQAILLLLLIPIFIYHPLMEITMNGQSLGKKITGIRVVNETGGRPSITQFLIRWLLRISDLWIAILFVLIVTLPAGRQDLERTFITLAALAFLITDIVLVVSSQKGQRIGDILAKTILISVRTRGNIEETVFQEVDDRYVPSFPQIMQLSDRDINAVKSILATARKKGDYHMAEAASAKIKSHLQIVNDMPAFDFLEIVMKDYNYLSTK